MTRITFAAVLAALLSACAAPQPPKSALIVCAEHGYQWGTPELQACARQLESQRAAVGQDILMGALSGMSGAFQPTIQCTSRQDISGVVITTCP